ncbi:manganese-dependent ADP-ribose/CDP-alcohol diphosphatase-like [Salvia splendens]|uniref:manganese-dependent ADP-ribose/CDP-alcohol diphosphatase-like n=1 Tax=Salvia splendens TaxID=180675 RepID=UPI001C2683BA|nr:manganese-dependent ADP-ribose/CDP-alcohol diphosphatase-like [Salvia splendens]
MIIFRILPTKTYGHRQKDFPLCLIVFLFLSLKRDDWSRRVECIKRVFRFCFSMSYGNVIVNAQGKQPLVSFGVISDVQYADIPDGRSFLGVPRYYQHSLLVLQRAVRSWNEKKVKFVINFGDIIDGFCPKEKSLSATKKVVGEFSNFSGNVYHMIGNHCLYNLPREKLLPLLNIDGHAYYDFSPVPEVRFVVLDGYDISSIGWPEGHPNRLKAIDILKEKNPNVDKNSPEGLVGPPRRFVQFNGAVGEEQMEWLDRVLQDATKLNQRVVVCSHLPLDPRATSFAALLWNYEEVMEVVHRYSCVKVCLAGHTHRDGYVMDSHGVHHRVLAAALECPPGTDAFGSVDIFEDSLFVSGTDRMGDQEMVFN